MWLYLFIMLSKYTYSLTILPSQVFPDYDSWKNSHCPKREQLPGTTQKGTCPNIKKLSQVFIY